ncbi:MAG: chromate transporter [Oscillospiraceae bacterium]|nr:chromate transporter [Oscillospiraceae bacterium]
MIYLQLFYEFFKIGLFAIGGGMATIPFLYALAERMPWYTAQELVNMIAISEATPGPTGINMATAAGFAAAGITGSFVSTFSLVLPAFICIVMVSRYLTKFYKSRRIQKAFYCLRPVVTAQIAAALLLVMQATLLYSGKNGWNAISYKAIILYGALFVLVRKYKLHPVVYLFIGGFTGWLLAL